MPTSYHVHTTWSDGTATIEEMVAAAKAAELTEIGISDHYVLTPDGATVPWSMDLNALPDYVAAVRSLIPPGGRPIIRLGIEIDYFPETITEIRKRFARLQLDYIIGAVHFVDGFPVDESRELWEQLTPRERNEIWRGYWARIKELAEARTFDVVAHLDLPKKFGVRPSVDLGMEIDAALDAIARAGLVVELNTAGWRKPIHEPYPSEALLRAVRSRAIPLVITSDAHAPDELVADYEKAFPLARQAGYRRVAIFDAGRHFSEGI